MENKRGEDDKVSGGVWQAVKTKVGETRMAEIERGRSKERSRKKMRRKRKREKTKKTEKGKNNKCEKSNRRMGDLR